MTRPATLLGLELPLLQAGMGAVAGPALCAAVSRAGAGGTLALYREPPARAARLVREAAVATDRPFGVNVVPEVTGPAACLDQLRAILPELPRGAFVTSFGLPDADAVRAVQAAGHPLVVQVGSLALGRGAAVLVLQGTEAGGHLLGRMPVDLLLAAVRARHPRAVLAVAGGIATGRDLADAVARGADGAMAGTLFVPAAESTAHPEFKRRVVEAVADDTLITSLFEIGWPHRPHRVLRNPPPPPRSAPRPRSSPPPGWTAGHTRFRATARRPGSHHHRAHRGDGHELRPLLHPRHRPAPGRRQRRPDSPGVRGRWRT
ncbi:nitronate monooxygenase [Streptomyces sp. NBC_00536]|uniref:NAD(P)H-dependent flavin oxidoreductase n=1 Tax=Streptomyces sp. NBC_00536 TaxID=2975769 RepID=UPI002E807E74|nr:nitronate monooxygenase [Streptomyces sp. NBC_00536]WUC82312.1 nitronate monooxygenase [Streptomyces sp. NBC_00536]